MADQRLFDNRGVNVVAAADDQILGPAGDIEIAIAVQPPQIARAQILIPGIKIAVLGRLGIGQSRRPPAPSEARIFTSQ